MFRCRRTFRFRATHHLPNEGHPEDRPHEHAYIAVVAVEFHQLKMATGILANVNAAWAILAQLYLRKKDLNQTTQLANPCVGRLAAWMFDRLRARVPEVSAVAIKDETGDQCEYTPDGIHDAPKKRGRGRPGRFSARPGQLCATQCASDNETATDDADSWDGGED